MSSQKHSVGDITALMLAVKVQFFISK